jgi:hypothetical protein
MLDMRFAMSTWKNLLLAGAASLLPVFGLGCEAQIGLPQQVEDGEGDDTIINEEAQSQEDTIANLTGQLVKDVVFSSCSTAPVRGLSEQLVQEVNCIQPGTLKSIANIPGVTLGSNAFPFLQAPAADALRNVTSNGSSLTVNSALRSLAQQFVLYSWYVNGRCTNVVTLAAAPGTSNHEKGLAIDTSQYQSMRARLESKGFKWHGSNDLVHFDYIGAGASNLSGLSTKAFQRLWNLNNPQDRIAEDGSYGPQTEARLKISPAAGFALGSTCSANPAPTVRAIGFEWFRNTDGSYDFTAGAPSDIVRVEYFVEGFSIGSATRAQNGDDFFINYTFNFEKSKRLVEIKGFTASGQELGLGVGMIDSIPQTAVFIWQRDEHTYTVGLERPTTSMASIELRVDGILIPDAISGLTRSTRLAVRNTYNTFGSRNFEVRIFNASGQLLQTQTRTLTIW